MEVNLPFDGPAHRASVSEDDLGRTSFLNDRMKRDLSFSFPE
jgi:hypothetical protein